MRSLWVLWVTKGLGEDHATQSNIYVMMAAYSVKQLQWPTSCTARWTSHTTKEDYLISLLKGSVSVFCDKKSIFECPFVLLCLLSGEAAAARIASEFIKLRSFCESVSRHLELSWHPDTETQQVNTITQILGAELRGFRKNVEIRPSSFIWLVQVWELSTFSRCKMQCKFL